MTKKQAVKYLEKVLKDWDAFCFGHRRFSEAIRILLVVEDEKDIKRSEKNEINTEQD